MNKDTKILDVTLRDGSYAINFQFSEYDTEVICEELYKSGIEYIEIGHGMGLDASSEKNGLALCTDEEYLKAAQKKVPNAKYGMFCIPTYANIESLDLLKKYGASFVRIGCNVTEVPTTEKFIRRAKELGLEVMSNYMKSYAVTPEEFAKNVKLSESYGADVIYIVDSTGSMDREDIYKYYKAIRDVSNIKIGFHGHNNLGLAISNALYAKELGFDFVDTSMLGIGRSAGNAATELYIGSLMKNNNNNIYDIKRILNCENRIIKPIWKHQPNALDLYCGISEFHTSYMKYIYKYAVKYRVNPLDLIREYTRFDKINMNEEVLADIASKMKKDESCVYSDFGFNEYIGNEQKN